jgi:hypothetical protein
MTANDPRSLFRGTHFARVLAVLRRRLGPQVLGRMLSIQPGSVELDFYAGGRIQSATVAFNGSFILGAGSVKYRGPLPGFRLSQLGGGTPATLIRRIAARFHAPVGDLYEINVFPNWFGMPIGWVVESSDHRQFQSAGSRDPVEESPPGIRESR